MSGYRNDKKDFTFSLIIHCLLKGGWLVGQRYPPITYNEGNDNTDDDDDNNLYLK